MKLPINVLSLSLQVLTDNTDYTRRQYYINIYNQTGSFNGDIRDEVINKLRRFIPDSVLPDGLWDGWWNQVLLTWLGISSPITARIQASGGCGQCGK